jgi:hypothetical protein
VGEVPILPDIIEASRLSAGFPAAAGYDYYETTKRATRGQRTISAMLWAIWLEYV